MSYYKEKISRELAKRKRAALAEEYAQEQQVRFGNDRLPNLYQNNNKQLGESYELPNPADQRNVGRRLAGLRKLAQRIKAGREGAEEKIKEEVVKKVKKQVFTKIILPVLSAVFPWFCIVVGVIILLGIGQFLACQTFFSQWIFEGIMGGSCNV